MKVFALAGVLVAAVALRRRGERPQPNLWQQAAGEVDRRGPEPTAVDISDTEADVGEATGGAGGPDPATGPDVDHVVPPEPGHAPGA